MKTTQSIKFPMKSTYFWTIFINLIILAVQAFLLWLWIYFINKNQIDNNDVADIYIVILVVLALILTLIWVGTYYVPKRKFIKKNYLSAKQEEMALSFSWKKTKTMDVKLGWILVLKWRFYIIFWISIVNLAFSLIVAVVFDTI